MRKMQKSKRLSLQINIPYPSLEWRKWMPSRGNVLFTSLAIMLMLFVQDAGALSSSVRLLRTSTSTVNYQGHLANNSGEPSSGNFAITFSLYDAAENGNLIWGPESHQAVAVNDGVFDIALGSQTTDGIPTDIWVGDRYLQIAVDGEDLTPREKVSSVPIAQIAVVATTLHVIRQDDSTNSSQDSQMLAGWGYMQGNDDVGLSEAITFGETFEEPPIVLVTYLGHSTSVPTSLHPFQGVSLGNEKVWTASPAHITEEGFTIEISRNTDLFGSNLYYGYSWIAVGQ